MERESFPSLGALGQNNTLTPNAGLLVLCTLIGLVAASAVLTPPCFWAGRALVHSGHLPALAPFGLPTYFRRILLILLIGSARPVWRRLGIRRAHDLGIGADAHPVKHLVAGFFLSTLVLGAALALLAQHEVVACDGIPLSLQTILWALSGAMSTAVCVAVLEETFFRGLLLGCLRASMPPRWASALVTVLFASVHFVAQPHHGAVVEDAPWWAGFALLGELFSPLTQPEAVGASLATLFVLGWVLGEATLRTRGLGLAIGLHAGLVLGARLVLRLGHVAVENNVWLKADLRGGLVPLAVMTTLFVLVTYLWPERTRTLPSIVS